jgi:N-acetylglucosaminyldiphosphoundecaprenol N-acetyl-beta-D-mannosaminyltransferase
MTDDFAREVYCLLGVPVDAVDMAQLVRLIDAKAVQGQPFFLSTPNINFIINSISDPDFRETLIRSDLCPPDGTALLWVARISGIPLKERVAGSDILEAVGSHRDRSNPIKAFLFGGGESVAQKAARQINERAYGLRCVGANYPGFVSVEQLGAARLIDEINSSGADFLVASLGAQKGQLWLARNHNRLKIPIRAHLGASLNFHAGVIKRAPGLLQGLGFEWLWRIKEEPHLWRRYWKDGLALANLFVTRTLPLALWTTLQSLPGVASRSNFGLTLSDSPAAVTLSVTGFCTKDAVEHTASVLRTAVDHRKRLILDFSKARLVDARFLGLMLMLQKTVMLNGSELIFRGVSPRLGRLFRLHGFVIPRSLEAEASAAVLQVV